MLDELCGRIKAFYKSENLVFGEGKKKAAIMLIGEAPGKDEVREKRPFCGKAGRNLDEFLYVLGLNRSDLYITNVCKFRPHKVSEKGTVSNRPPTRVEIEAALPFLCEEINAISPRIIVTLGNTPLRACFGDFKKSIGDVHGRMLDIRIGDREYHLFPLYHPASIIYNRALKTVYEEDLARLKKYVE